MQIDPVTEKAVLPHNATTQGPEVPDAEDSDDSESGTAFNSTESVNDWSDIMEMSENLRKFQENAMQTSTPPSSGDSAFPIDKRWKDLTRTLTNRPSTMRGLHHCDLCSDDTTLSYLTRSQKYTIGDLQRHLYHSHMLCQRNDDLCKWGMHTNSSELLRSHPFIQTDEKYSCPECPFSTTLLRTIKYHMSTHAHSLNTDMQEIQVMALIVNCVKERGDTIMKKELIHLREQRQAQRKSKSTKRIQRKEKEADLPNEDGVPQQLTKVLHCV
jgi:hypothetical protein